MILHLYFVRKFMTSFLLVLAVFFAIIMLVDMVEQIRRFEGDAVGLPEAFQLSLLHAPQNLYRILPLLVVLSTLAMFLGLARSSELVVTRAAGRSALRSLWAPVGAALLLGILGIVAINPIVAATSHQYEQVTNRYARGEAAVLSVGAEGLWLRQSGRSGQMVIHAQRSNLDGTSLYDVNFLAFGDEGQPLWRVDAEAATLSPGKWQLENAKRWNFDGAGNPERTSLVLPSMVISSNLTREEIRESFGEPQAIPIWELPAFIDRLENAGFSAVQHRVWFWMELAMPLMLVAMVLIAAGFTMRHTRFGRTGMMVLFAILLGFGVYFLRTFAQVLGDNGQIPVLLAAWAPPAAGILMSLGLLLHTEDG
ncbi:MAG TPA: LPS export ABC transporter permease LptG [Aliiroseovarius sp.]|nr:LPS export ABC transporter permease LptG [Aliiroseovarius sp.]